MYAKSCSIQLWNEPFRSETSSGPSARAGLIEALVSGPTVMMIATTTRPMTRPAQPSGERVSTMPRMVNMRIPVARASTNIAEPQAVTSLLKSTTPKPEPKSKTRLPNDAQIASAPPIAPATCAAQYAGTPLQGKRLVAASANVTAGLMWHPDTLPTV